MTSTAPAHPSLLGAWLMATRPATLTAALAPVALGTAVAHVTGGVRPGPALAALGGALLLQILANLANDLFDHEKGADTAERLGPTRVVQAGLLSPRAVRAGMAVTTALALGLGVYLTAVAGPLIVAVGVASILAALAYTGGPYPLGYNGLGEVFVLVFFGFVAVGGTVFVQTGTVPALALLAALPAGSLASCVLVVNNVRDRETDVRAGKRTLAVRWGRRAAVVEYGALVALSYAVPPLIVGLGLAGVTALLPLISLPFAVHLARRVAREEGRALNRRLVGTAQLVLLFALLFAVGIAAGPPAAR